MEELHSKNIYVIGRISVFQDHYLVGRRPELAVRRKSDGKVWKDFKGISWLDPARRMCGTMSWLWLKNLMALVLTNLILIT